MGQKGPHLVLYKSAGIYPSVIGPRRGLFTGSGGGGRGGYPEIPRKPGFPRPMSLSDFPGKTRKVQPDVFISFIHDYGGTPALSLQILNPWTIGRSLSLNTDVFSFLLIFIPSLFLVFLIPRSTRQFILLITVRPRRRYPD